MARRDKAPAPIVKLLAGRLSPATAYDAEELAGYASGTEFDLIARTKRSHPHNGKYWAILSKVVTATEMWPSREHMHKAVKFSIGYTEKIYGADGSVLCVIPDSTSFETMTQSEFNAFYDSAMRWMSESLGIDPETI